MKKITLLLTLLSICSFPLFAQGMEIPKGFCQYQVQAGDALGKIAPKNTWGIIQRINRIDPRHLPLGKSILVPCAPDNVPDFCPVPQKAPSAEQQTRLVHIFVGIQYFGAYENGQLVFWGPISSADSSHQTPIGNFFISRKIKKYFSHSKECYGAPMPFALNLSGSAHFIHQQSLPGKPASHGCIRLLMEDAKKLFYWIQINDPVVISK